MQLKLKNGFTLIELLVVISIIGILIGLSIFGLQGARESSRDAKRKADLELIRSGLEIYKADCNVYPQTLTWGGSLLGSGSPAACAIANSYISSIPADPISPTNIYFYNRLTTTKYVICAALERTPNPAPDPSGPIQNCGSCGSGGSCNYVVTNP